MNEQYLFMFIQNNKQENKKTQTVYTAKQTSNTLQNKLDISNILKKVLNRAFIQ